MKSKSLFTDNKKEIVENYTKGPSPLNGNVSEWCQEIIQNGNNSDLKKKS